MRRLVLSNHARLERIAQIIEAVDNRCMAVDGPVTPTLREMRQDELSEIYQLANARVHPMDEPSRVRPALSELPHGSGSGE